MIKNTSSKAQDHTQKTKKTVIGEVVSDSMNKTITVKVMRTLRHALYQKTIKRFKKYKVHDEANAAKVGDIVEIVECRPLSKTKHMMLNRIIETNS